MLLAQTLSWQWSPWSALAAGLLLCGTAALCYTAWRRSRYALGTGLLELLRFTIVTLIVITLMQPEWLTIEKPQEPPTVVVLTDVSRSMDTRDVLDEGSTGNSPQTRAAAAAPLADEQLWSSFAGHFKVAFE